MLREIKAVLSLRLYGWTKSSGLVRLQGRLYALTRQQKLLAILVATGAVLRLLLLADKSVWLDEAFSITISQRGWVDLLKMVSQTDTHPPLYYLVLKIWLVFGDGAIQVRLLSTIFSIASIVLIYLLAVKVFEDERIGLIAAAVLAFSPFHVWYAQETRMYAMLIFFVLASAYFFFRALGSGDGRDWFWYVLTTVFALYTDNGAIWYVVTISIFFLLSVRRYKERLKSWLISMVAIGLLYLPWLPFFWMQTRRVTEDFWLQPPSFHTVLETFLDFHSFNFPFIELSLIYMTMIFIWAYIIPKKAWQLRLASMWLFIPLVISLLLSLRQPIFLSRNLIAASLGYCLLVAGTIGQFRSTKAILALILPLIAMNVIAIGYNTFYEQKEDWRSVTSYVAQDVRERPGGLVVFLPGYAELPFRYYFKDYDVLVKTQGYPGDEVLLHPKPREVESLAELFADVPFVWLVVRDIESADPNWSVKEWLDGNGYVRQKDLVSENLTILTYYRWDQIPGGQPPQSPASEAEVDVPAGSGDTAYQTYVVGPGETLLLIALRFDTTVQMLMDANHLQNPNDIFEGQELLIPMAATQTPTPGNPNP